jgi:hypothetical protein
MAGLQRIRITAEPTVSTAGSRMMASCKACWRSCIAAKEISCAASDWPMINPVSCWGKKPCGVSVTAKTRHCYSLRPNSSPARPRSLTGAPPTWSVNCPLRKSGWLLRRIGQSPAAPDQGWGGGRAGCDHVRHRRSHARPHVGAYQFRPRRACSGAHPRRVMPGIVGLKPEGHRCR